MITIEQMVQREVPCCMSSLVSTLAGGYGDLGDLNKDFRDLAEQAFELAAPALDYEEAATQAGWHKIVGTNSWRMPAPDDSDDEITDEVIEDSAEAACRIDGIDPYEWEVYEFWAVSQWLADKLIAQGERVDTDFASLNIWARTTTGQAIAMDGCIARIYAKMMVPHDSTATGA